MRTSNEKSKKRSRISAMSVTFICLCMLIGSVLTGCGGESTTSTDNSSVGETIVAQLSRQKSKIFIMN